jgi:YidC/Oxa1 family membrane protein insertase
MDTQKIILFIVLSFSILMLWEAWNKEQQPQFISQPQKNGPHPVTTAPPGTKVASPEIVSPVLEKAQRIKVTTDNFIVEIDTQGGDVRHLELLKQKEAHDKSKNYLLLEDDPKKVYIAQSGLLGEDLPNHKSIYTVENQNYVLSPSANELEVRLNWSSTKGITVVKTFTFHRNSYLIDVSYTIDNKSKDSLIPSAYFQLLRTNSPPKEDSKFVHTYTGPAFYSEQSKFRKASFDDIEKNKAELPAEANNGWVAMLQHYFLSAWLPKGSVSRKFYAKHVGDGLYSAGILLQEPVGIIPVASAGKISAELYVGPQEQAALSMVAPGLDLSVDYGWLTVIAAPLYWVLDHIHRWVNNWGVAIIILTVLIKLAFFPLSAKSYRSMANMRKVTPKLQKIKEKYGDDRQRMNQAMMELYKTEKINPLGGCLPVIVQIPVFIALYWVLLYSVEMRQAPFIGWITDLSAADPYFILPGLMGITMIIQTKLNPTPPDPIQAKVMMIMPFAMAVFFVFFPAGLVLYWVVNNILSISQQWYITRKLEKAVI